MNLLDQLRAGRVASDWGALGYSGNPFPPRGRVTPKVSVDRPEVAEVVASLASFLYGAGQGRTWAVAGEAGVGKSNFLQSVDLQLESASEQGLVTGVAHAYLTSQQMNPRALTEALARAFGEERFVELIGWLARTRPPIAPAFVGTQLGEFLAAIIEGSATDHASAAKFCLHWLGGQQTYAAERAPFGVRSRERVPPALALPWLRHVLDLMVEAKILSRVVLLLDEFEDVQALGAASQHDYLMTLKGLVNAFNVERLFLVIAGQHTAFARMGDRFPSLRERWQVVSLESLRRPDDAVRLVRAFSDFEHKRWLSEQPNRPSIAELRPNELEIKATFGDLLAKSPGRGVTQRELLATMHDLLEQVVRRT